jgi:PAP2 superfamily
VTAASPIRDPNRWQPLRITRSDGSTFVQRFIAPHWHLVRPFAIPSPELLRPEVRPAQAGEPRYEQQVAQVLEYSAGLTDRHKAIAEYWADGPNSEQPPGHWNLFGQFVSARDRHGLGEDVVLFFALNNALFDAGIACWECKRYYDYVRPISAVHYLLGNQITQAWAGPFQGTGLIRGHDWRPYQAPSFVTPPFAEFTSGHSTFSAAGAEILRRFTGSDRFGVTVVQRAGKSFIEPGLVPAQDVRLSYRTFREAADEAGLSRRYGGIHFADADLGGRTAGRKVAGYVWDKAMSYVTGTAGEAAQ